MWGGWGRQRRCQPGPGWGSGATGGLFQPRLFPGSPQPILEPGLVGAPGCLTWALTQLVWQQGFETPNESQSPSGHLDALGCCLSAIM